MICETCHGTGFAAHMSPARPCEECGGTGWTHCCEGLRPANEPTTPVHPSFARDFCRHGIDRSDCATCDPPPEYR